MQEIDLILAFAQSCQLRSRPCKTPETCMNRREAMEIWT